MNKYLISLMITLFSLDVIANPVLQVLPNIPKTTLNPPPTLYIPDVPSTGLKTYGNGLPLPEFLSITLGDMASKPYVLSSRAAVSRDLISADLTRFEKQDPLKLVRSILKGMGYIIREVDGVLFVDVKTEEDVKEVPKHIFVYEPSHRDSVNLASYSSLFPNLMFSFGSKPGGNSNWSDSNISYQSFTPSSPGASSYLVVRGEQADLREFKGFLEQVDTQKPEVMLRTYVFEVRDSENRDSAVNLVLNLLGGKLGSNASFADSAMGSFRLSLPNLSLAVQSLTGDSRIRLLSSPVLRASSGSTSSARIGTEVPAVDSIVTADGVAQQSVSYQSAGVLLNIRPEVFKESIQLQINQELSSFVQTEAGYRDAPTKLMRSFNSDVVATDGEIILLGGLTDVTESETESKGFFFKSKTKSKTYSELVVLIKVDKL